MAAKLLMMDFKVSTGSAELAAPAISAGLPNLFDVAAPAGAIERDWLAWLAGTGFRSVRV